MATSSKPQPQVPAANAADRAKAVGMALLIGGATLALFWGGTRCDFVNLDDDLYVYQNPHLDSGLSLTGLRYALTSVEGGSWMPLTWLSYLLDKALWGNQAAGYHATNIALHALAAGLLCLALVRMTRALWPSVLAAALFAVHPLRLESVIWIAERKDVLSIVFLMLTLMAYARYAAKPGRARMAGTLICLLLGLLAKPMLVTVPALLLLLDVWPLHRTGTRWSMLKPKLGPLVAEKIPLILACLLLAIITLLTQSAAGAVAPRAETGLLRALRVADNYGFYLTKIFWPDSLSVLYPLDPLSLGRAVLALALVLGVSVVALRWAGSWPWLAVGWFWFLISLFPVIGVVPIGSTWVADRYTYLPSVGIALMLAWTATSLAAKSRWGRHGASVVSLLLIVVLAGVTRSNLPRWQDSRTLFSDAVSKGPHPGAHQNLGVALAAQGNYSSAIEHYTRALGLDPDFAEAYYNRANAYQALGETERALADFSRAITLKPDHAAAHNNRGTLLAARGEFAAAIRDFTQAIALRSNYPDALVNRGRAYLELGKYREAVEDYSKAIALDPDFSAAYHDRAVAYYHLKDYERAWADIHICRELGLTPNPELVRRLQADSGQRE